MNFHFAAGSRGSWILKAAVEAGSCAFRILVLFSRESMRTLDLILRILPCVPMNLGSWHYFLLSDLVHIRSCFFAMSFFGIEK